MLHLDLAYVHTRNLLATCRSWPARSRPMLKDSSAK